MSPYLKQSESAMSLTLANNWHALHNRLLLSTDDVEEVDLNGNTPLLVAAYNGFPECLRELLNVGHANYKQLNLFGQNALTLATHRGCEACVTRLLDKWPYEHYTKNSLTPPLCVAAMRGNMRLVTLFCQMYPSPEHIRTVHSIDVLTLAKIYGQRRIGEYVKYVIQTKTPALNSKR